MSIGEQEIGDHSILDKVCIDFSASQTEHQDGWGEATYFCSHKTLSGMLNLFYVLIYFNAIKLL